MPRSSSRKSRKIVLEDRRKAYHARQDKASSDDSIHETEYQSITAFDASYLKTLRDAGDNAIGDEQHEECPTELHYNALNTSYDPFLPNLGGLSPRHLSLVHTYMHDLAPLAFGIPRQTIYVPANCITQLCLRYSHAGSFLTAILAEEMMYTLSGQPRTHEMVLQKAAGRKVFVEALRCYRTDFQAAWIALIKAAQVSLWFGDKKSQAVQWVAADMLIRSVGGLRRALSLSPDIEPIYIASPFYWVRSLVSSHNLLEQVTSRFLTSLNNLLEQNKPGQTDVAQIAHSPIFGDKNALEEHLGLETEIIQMFEPFTEPLASSEVAPQRFRLMLLLELCWIQTTFSTQPRLLTDVFKEIKSLFRGIPYPNGRKELELRPAAYAAIVAHARGLVVSMNNQSARLDSPLLLTQLEIDGSSAFDYLNSESRYKISTRLYSSFRHVAGKSQAFTQNEITGFVAEAVSNWVAP